MERSATDGGSSNFEVYRAKSVPRTYFVVSASAVRRGPDPPRLAHHFEPVPALERLAADLAEASRAAGGARVPVTLKVHGYNVRRETFEREILWDADPALRYVLRPRHKPPPGFDPERETFRPGNRFLIGFRWPSEGIFTRGSLKDTAVALLLTPAIGIFLLLLPLLTLLMSRRLARLVEGSSPWLAHGFDALGLRMEALRAGAAAWLRGWWPPAADFLAAFLSPYGEATVAAVLLGAGLLLLALRVSTYLRDRYRVLHYGVPDLGEFLRALEEALVGRGVRLRVDVIGHSMGALLLINAFRVMSDYFHGGGPGGPPTRANTLGREETFELGTLLLCAPDIPAVMVAPDRNNYFLSALRRFAAVHVFSSDRDVILKWLSSLANWASEPRQDMAGRKLGNVLLVKSRPPALGRQDSRNGWTLWPVTRPVLGNHHVYERDPLGARAPASLHFHDCTRDASVSGAGASELVVTAAAVAALGLLGLVTLPGLLRWLASGITVFLGLGLVCRPLWPRLRDRGVIGGAAGLFAEWPVLTMFLTLWKGWNPHGGYFMFCRPPRQRINALLRAPDSFPPRDAEGREIEELDGHIRYKLVRVSV